MGIAGMGFYFFAWDLGAKFLRFKISKKNFFWI